MISWFFRNGDLTDFGLVAATCAIIIGAILMMASVITT